MTRQAEMDFLRDQIANEGDKEISRILWTAYCYHYDVEVDTCGYDISMNTLYNWCKKYNYIQDAGDTFEEFYNFMSKFLV